MRRTFPTCSDNLHDHAALVRIARCLVRDAADADDLVQDALVIALEGGRTDAVIDRAWVRGVMRNLARRSWRDRRRRRRRETRVASPDRLADSTNEVAKVETRRALSQSISVLPDDYRVPLLMQYMDGLTPQAIAHEMGLSPSTVRTRLQRGRDRLRRQLEVRFNSPRDALGLALLPIALERIPSMAEVSAAGGGVAASAAASGSLGWRAAALLCLGVLIAVPGAQDPELQTALVEHSPLTTLGNAQLLADADADRTTLTPAQRRDAGFRGAGVRGDGNASASSEASGSAAVTEGRAVDALPARAIRGMVRDVSRPTAGVVVAAFRLGADGPLGRPGATTRTTDDGTFELSLPREGAWLIAAAVPGRAPAHTVVSETNPGHVLTLTLPDGVSPDVSLEDPTASRAPGVGADDALIATVRAGTPDAHTLELDTEHHKLSWANGVLAWHTVSLPVGALREIEAAGLGAGDYVVELVATTAGERRVVETRSLTIAPPLPDVPLAPRETAPVIADTEASPDSPADEPAPTDEEQPLPPNEPRDWLTPDDGRERAGSAGQRPPHATHTAALPSGNDPATRPDGTPVRVQVREPRAQLVLTPGWTGQPSPTVPDWSFPNTPAPVPGDATPGDLGSPIPPTPLPQPTNPTVPTDVIPIPMTPVPATPLPTEPAPVPESALPPARTIGETGAGPATALVTPALLRLIHAEPESAPRIYVVSRVDAGAGSAKPGETITGMLVGSNEGALALPAGLYRIALHGAHEDEARAVYIPLQPGEHVILPMDQL